VTLTKPYVVALSLVLLLAALYGGWQLESQARQRSSDRRYASAERTMAAVSWPNDLSPAKGDQTCFPSVDRLCFVTLSDSAIAAHEVAHALGVSNASVKPGPRLGGAPPLYGFYANIGGVPASVDVTPRLEVTGAGKNAKITFPGSVVLVWLIK
jgi:hypothetical protein